MALVKKNSQKLERDISPYAIIRVCGKQYKVANGDRITLDKLPKKVKLSETQIASSGSNSDNLDGNLVITDVLLLSDNGLSTKEQSNQTQSKIIIGTPTINGASISLRLLKDTLGKKIRIFKKKRRTGYTKRQGHRQKHTVVLVQSINWPS